MKSQKNLVALAMPILSWLVTSLLVSGIAYLYRDYLLYIGTAWFIFLMGGMTLLPTRNDTFHAIQIGIFTGLCVGVVFSMGTLK